MRIRLFLVVAISLSVVAAPAAARQPSKAPLPRMVLPDASLAGLAGGLGEKFAFFSNANDGAASSPDPNDTGADLRRLGRVAGYVRGRNTAGAFSDRAPKRLLAVSTSVILWRDAGAAAASIERDIAAGRRFRGKPIEGGLDRELCRDQGAVVRSGRSAHALTFAPDGLNRSLHDASDFRVGPLRGNALVVHGDKRYDDRGTAARRGPKTA